MKNVLNRREEKIDFRKIYTHISHLLKVFMKQVEYYLSSC